MRAFSQSLQVAVNFFILFVRERVYLEQSNRLAVNVPSLVLLFEYVYTVRSSRNSFCFREIYISAVYSGTVNTVNAYVGCVLSQWKTLSIYQPTKR